MIRSNFVSKGSVKWSSLQKLKILTWINFALQYNGLISPGPFDKPNTISLRLFVMTACSEEFYYQVYVQVTYVATNMIEICQILSKVQQYLARQLILNLITSEEIFSQCNSDSVGRHLICSFLKCLLHTNMLWDLHSRINCQRFLQLIR